MRKDILYLIVIIFICKTGLAVFYSYPKNPLRFSKLNTGILLQRYYFNTYHSKNVNSGISFMLGFHQEFATDGLKNKNFVSIGAEYLYQSFFFNSYYFTQDTMRIYDGKMDYSYHIKLSEIGVPLLYKHNFSRENNDMNGVFFSVGYVYRILLPANISISREGREIDNVTIRPVFKSAVLSRSANSYVHFSIGFQKNNPQGKMKMYVEIFGRYGFSPFYVTTAKSANNLFFGNYFIGLSTGIKWRR